MKKVDEISKLLNRRLSNAAAGTFDAMVMEVDEQKRTCKVKVGNIEYEDVSLFRTEDETLKGFCLIPKIHSLVLVSRIGGSNMLYVSMFSEIVKVIITVNDEERDKDREITTPDKNLATFEISVDGFKITRNDSGLKKTLSDLCDAITQLTVPTNAGPSGIPINAAKFNAIKMELKEYLND